MDVKKIIPQEFYDEISEFEKIIVLVSGGVDSTYSAIKIKEHFPQKDILLLHGQTGLEMRSSKTTIQLLAEKLELPLEFYIPTVNPYEEVKKAFSKLDLQMKRKEEGKPYDRTYWGCCGSLKKKPFKTWVKKNYSLDTIIISSITRDESTQRFLRLYELEQQNTFIWFLITFQAFYAYPLRDCDSKIQKRKRQEPCESILNFLVCSSGCELCPILLYAKKFKEEPRRYLKSKKFFLQHFKGMNFCGQLTKNIEEYLVAES